MFSLQAFLPQIFSAAISVSMLTIFPFIKNQNIIKNISIINAISVAFILSQTKFGFFFSLSLMCLMIIWNVIKNHNFSLKEETFPLAILSVVGSSFLVEALFLYDLIAIYLGIELQAISLYILITIGKKNQTKNDIEASLKYFLYASVASCFIVFGFSLLYVDNSTLNLLNIFTNSEKTNLSIVAFVFICTGLFFKLGLFPFHFWAPDVYQITDLRLLPLIAGTTKFSLVCVLSFVPIILNGLQKQNFAFYYIIFFAILTVIFTSILSLKQKNITRLLGYGGLFNVGFFITIFMAAFFSSNIQDGESLFHFLQTIPSLTSVSAVYFLSYIIIICAVSVCVCCLQNKNLEDITIKDLSSVFKKDKKMALLLTICMLLLIGVPPTSSFVSKALVITFVAISQTYLWLKVAIFLALIFGSCVIAFPYLSAIKQIYFEEEKNDCTIEADFTSLKVCTFFVILSFIFIFWFSYYLMYLKI